MVRKDDASKINRIVERFKLNTSNETKIVATVQKGIDERIKEGQVIKDTNDLNEKVNDNIEKIVIAKPNNEKQSVKETLTDILIESKAPKERTPKTQKDVMREIQLRKEAKEKMQVLNKEDIDTKNFNQAKIVTSPQSEPYSKISQIENRPSIKKELDDIKKELDLKNKHSNTKSNVKSNKYKNKISKSKGR
jgi:hypothetical protein